MLLYFENFFGHSFLLIKWQSLWYIYKTHMRWFNLCSLLNLFTSTYFWNQLLLLSFNYYSIDALLKDHPTCYIKFHCVKSVQIRSFFWSVLNRRIQSKYSKTRTRKNLVFGQFSRRFWILRLPWPFFLSFNYVTSILKLWETSKDQLFWTQDCIFRTFA